MKVRRYFVGFGPTLWSTRRPNKLGYTEYGVKADPARRILRHRGHDRRSTRSPRRTAATRCTSRRRGSASRCCSPGPAMNFVIGLVLIYAIARDLGPAEPAPADRRVSSAKPRVSHRNQQGQAGRLQRSRTGGAAGIKRRRRDRQGRRHRRVATFDEMVAAVRKATGPDRRSSSSATAHADHHRRRRHPDPAVHRTPTTSPSTVGAIGVARRPVRAHAVQPGVGGPRHVRVHRRPGRRTGQVAGEDPHQDRRAGALDRRRRTRPRDADQRRRAPASSAATPSSAGCGWRSGSSWPS